MIFEIFFSKQTLTLLETYIITNVISYTTYYDNIIDKSELDSILYVPFIATMVESTPTKMIVFHKWLSCRRPSLFGEIVHDSERFELINQPPELTSVCHEPKFNQP